MEVFLTLVGMAGIAATVLPLLRKDAWWIRVFDFPRLQIVAVLAATLVLYAVVARDPAVPGYALMVALGASLAWQGRMIFPYTRLCPRQVQDSTGSGEAVTIRLLFANVLMTNRNAARLLSLVREADPDVFLAVEADAWWQAALRPMEESHVYTVQQPQENTYGMLLYSRLKLLRTRVRYLVEPDVPSIHACVRLTPKIGVDLHCLHPRPPVPAEDDSSTGRDAELLLVGREIRNSRTPVIVMGDLNDVAWSRTSMLFKDISGLLDPRVGRGFYHTFHAGHFFIRFPLDHFFHSKHFRLVTFRRLDRFGSDHFPVYIELSHEPPAAREQEEPQASDGQQQEAEQKIRAAR